MTIAKRRAPRRRIEAPAWMPINMMLESHRCEAKRVFATRNDAKQFARTVKRQYAQHQRAYHCPVCGRWHLTTVRA